jgi:hypothetical protein
MKKLILAFVICLLLAVIVWPVTPTPTCIVWQVDRGWSNNTAACSTTTTYSVQHSTDVAFALNSSPPQVYELKQVNGSDTCFNFGQPYVVIESGTIHDSSECYKFWQKRLFVHDNAGNLLQADAAYKQGCDCTDSGTPVLIPLSPNGLADALTDANNGVDFDLTRSGAARWSWTRVDAEAGWLAADYDEDGAIRDGTYLFGNVSGDDAPAFEGESDNGFRSLRAHDRNRDGVINASDGIWRLLRVWTDINHNGTSEPAELHRLSDVGIVSLSLAYKEDQRQDPSGNTFRFRAPIQMADGSVRQAYDVFLQKQ